MKWVERELRFMRSQDLEVRLPSELVNRLLTQAVSESLQQPNDRNEPVMFQWSVYQLLQRLDADPDVADAQIAQLEWMYLPLLEHSERQPVVLHRWMSKQPAFFVEVVSAMYRAYSESGSDGDMVTETQKTLASQAYRLMDRGQHCQGSRMDNWDGTILQSWVRDAHRLAVNAERGAVGDVYIGSNPFTKHATQDQDGVWPPKPVRELIEELEKCITSKMGL